MKMEANVIKLTSESNWNTSLDVVMGECVKPEPGTDDYEKVLKECKHKYFQAQDLIVLMCNSAAEIWSKLLTALKKKNPKLV
ncbi:hypothetical protein PR048_009906 [Dryococelus australis]|uniref:Uncharacterized protein n=1 Tax=Dryococelus australis TaxID=614101 RepID=A0ABQ9I179_9NEOP|nr:hypothetical protein PR048_009906 [Dryococelus australis]